MRVIAGVAKGRVLQAPKGAGIRPTADRVKEALFNILGSLMRMEGARFLDLYAGVGSIGIEALSRGAELAVFVENEPRHLRFLKKNLTLFPMEKAWVYAESVLLFLRRTHSTPYDCVYLDPPYQQLEIKQVLPLLLRDDMICPGGVVVVEHFHKMVVPDAAGLSLLKRYKYGGTLLSVYTRTTALCGLSGNI